MSSMILTVDGPSGTGKSTVSKAVAARVGIPYLDTGAFYRAATLAALRSGVDLADEAAVFEVVAVARLDQSDGLMTLDGDDINDEIRGDAVTKAVSQLSALPRVRELLVDLQRIWVEKRGSRAVVEGRDIGSIVFPDADVRVYLDARPEVRALRRAVQVGADLEETIDDLNRRDRADSTRAASPLAVPEGAHVLDTSDLSFEEVVEAVVGLLDAKSSTSG
ncbi:MAG: (d)CMP kinase [Actinomycetota bacterium]|nr:(d)CMP kinase [Actinomycetota bacterium]